MKNYLKFLVMALVLSCLYPLAIYSDEYTSTDNQSSGYTQDYSNSNFEPSPVNNQNNNDYQSGNAQSYYNENSNSYYPYFYPYYYPSFFRGQFRVHNSREMGLVKSPRGQSHK